MVSKFIEKDEYEYIKALIQEEKNPDEAIKQYDSIISGYEKKLDGINKKLEQSGGNTEKTLSSANERKNIVVRLVCVISNKARISWEAKDFAKTEQVFAEHESYCKDNETFNMNIGHALFMQEGKYHEASKYYADIVYKHKDNLNKVDIFVLANLSLCYIFTKQQDKAKKLIDTIKKHEEKASENNPGVVLLHYCSVNLVIGTLYCSKGTFEFGLDLIIKNLYPINEKLGTDTWHYVKRCLLAFIEQLTKNQIVLKDKMFLEKLIDFLEDAQSHGKNITTVSFCIEL
jgi:tetratricopeptide repeat protein 30